MSKGFCLDPTTFDRIEDSPLLPVKWNVANTYHKKQPTCVILPGTQ
jgi:hypothetical protein